MTETIPALRKTYSLPLPAPQAFDLFTQGLVDWWPLKSHSLSGREGRTSLALRLEPHEGGRITETRHDGNPADWAEVIAWEPGRRLVLAWHVGRARSDATQVDITFRAGAAGGSALELVHSGFEVLGPAGTAAAANYDEGWDMVLGEEFRRACEGRA